MDTAAYLFLTAVMVFLTLCLYFLYNIELSLQERDRKKGQTRLANAALSNSAPREGSLFAWPKGCVVAEVVTWSREQQRSDNERAYGAIEAATVHRSEQYWGRWLHLSVPPGSGTRSIVAHHDSSGKSGDALQNGPDFPVHRRAWKRLWRGGQGRGKVRCRHGQRAMAGFSTYRRQERGLGVLQTRNGNWERGRGRKRTAWCSQAVCRRKFGIRGDIGRGEDQAWGRVP